MTLRATLLRNYVLTFTALLFVMQLAAISAQAQIPITQCGTNIEAPGSYILANDLLGCESGILIRSGGVTLNLNGHLITGLEILRSRGIWAMVPAGEGVIIEGPGTVARFYTGVQVDLARGGSYIVGVTSQDNHYGFFVANGGDVTLGLNTAVNNQIGFVIFLTTGSTFAENTANANSQIGFQINGNGNRFILNTANNNGSYGIQVLRGFNNLIATNTALRNSGYDLDELYGTCLNIWVNNIFNTANLPCIH